MPAGRRLTVVMLLALCGTAALRSQGPPRRFQLRVPSESSEAFTGKRIALTRERVPKLVIEILEPLAGSVQTDRLYPKINGEAASTVSELRRTRRGYALILDLELKPHVRLQPGKNTVEIVAVNQRGRRFYRNWIVEVRQRSYHEWFTYEFAAAPGVDHPAPPDIEVLSPVVPPVREAGVESLAMPVRARVSAHHPIAELRLDGSVIAAARERLEAEVERRLTVSEPRREVAIEAVDVRGNRTRVRIPIVAAAGTPPPRFSGRRYLLSVGISAHGSEASSPPALPGAASDAEELARVAVERKLVDDSSLMVLTDGEATLARVRSALRDFSAQPLEDDLLVVFVSGYGLHGSDADADQAYLACWDTRLDQLAATALDLDELARLLEDESLVRSRNILLLFELRDLPGAESASSSNLVNARLLALASAERGRTVLVSAEVGQSTRSRTAADGRVGGIFSAALVKGLAGAADWNRDRVVTVPELFHFVSTEVKRESAGEQVPAYRISDREAAVVGLANR